MYLFNKHLKPYLPYFFQMAFTISVVGILLFFVDFGFSQSPAFQRYLTGCYIVVLVVGVLATLLRYANREKSLKRSVLLFDTLSILLTMAILIVHFFGERAQQQMSILYDDNLLKFTIILTFIREFSELNIRFKQTVLNPAQLFILSFLTIILVGALLLMLPNATHDGLSFIDALFTSTSAVCVTGLLVVDTASHFTLFGQIIILFLIQTGGLGILTFANYFSYFFKGGATYETQLTISGMTGSNKLGEVFSTLKRIILITFSIELFTAVLLYLSLDPNLFKSFFEQVFFSVFHAVSAFCNAGFSTLTQGLYDLDFRFNYVFQIIIMMAFVLGGLGFPIVVNLLKYIRYYIKRKFFYFSGRKEMHIPWIINLNSRITLATTTILTIVGTSVFFIVEYSNTLAEHKGIGKFITALFSATTPRTAGFNTVDIAALDMATLLMIFLLMWIGASPASTGGGIKTSTFAIATLNFINLARGKTRIEVYRREIAEISIHRAFAVIALSLIVIGAGIVLLSTFESDKSFLSIAFECFSAYSTAGFHTGITASLSAPSKLVIIVVMFVGRVSMLTVMIAIVKKLKQQNYRYPIEEITIN